MMYSHLSLPRLTGALAALALLALAAPAAHAQTVVFDNGSPDGSVAAFSDSGTPAILPNRSFSAETFRFDSAATFDTVEWFGTYAFGNTPPAKDNFTITFYETTGGTPNINPFATFTVGDAVNRTATGGTIFSSTVFQYTSRLSGPQTLGPGTYGIGIVNDTTSDTDDDWLWSFSAQTGTNFFRGNESDPFLTRDGELSFRLLNSGQVAAIPEPSEWATGGLIAATLLIGMVRARRRKIADKPA